MAHMLLEFQGGALAFRLHYGFGSVFMQMNLVAVKSDPGCITDVWERAQDCSFGSHSLLVVLRVLLPSDSHRHFAAGGWLVILVQLCSMVAVSFCFALPSLLCYCRFAFGSCILARAALSRLVLVLGLRLYFFYCNFISCNLWLWICKLALKWVIGYWYCMDNGFKN